MTLLRFPCEYRCTSGKRFSSDVLASREDLDLILAARGIGEICEFEPTSRLESSYKPLSDLIERKGATPETLHYAIFVGWLAIKSGTASVDDILGDCGLVHELAHFLQFGEHPTKLDIGELVAMARRIERAIPGSPWPVDCGSNERGFKQCS